jgi:hypothetical protein
MGGSDPLDEEYSAAGTGPRDPLTLPTANGQRRFLACEDGHRVFMDKQKTATSPLSSAQRWDALSVPSAVRGLTTLLPCIASTSIISKAFRN